MANDKKEKLFRREVREQMKTVQPMKVVPSKKGLATVFLFCAGLGFTTGVIVHHYAQHFVSR